MPNTDGVILSTAFGWECPECGHFQYLMPEANIVNGRIRRHTPTDVTCEKCKNSYDADETESLENLLCACDSELSAIAAGRPADRDTCSRLSWMLRAWYE